MIFEFLETLVDLLQAPKKILVDSFFPDGKDKDALNDCINTESKYINAIVGYFVK